MVGVVSGQHITISTTLLANFDVCQKIFIRGTSCFGFEAEPHTGERMDMVIEKATELGVKSIHPILADRSVKNKLNMERAQRIVISACKQAGRSIFPKIHDPKPFNAWLEFYENDKKIFFHLKNECFFSRFLPHSLKN